MPSGKPPKIPPELSALFSLGWGIAAWITAGVLLGRWVDGRWGLQPWGTLAGALGGIAGAGWTVYRIVRRLDDSKDASNKPPKSDESTSDGSKTTGRS